MMKGTKISPHFILLGKVTGGSGEVSVNSKIFFHNLTNLRPSLTPVKEVKGPVGEIHQAERLIFAVEQHKVNLYIHN